MVVVMTAATMQAAGCSELRLNGGETAENMFQAPQTLALVRAACDGDLSKMDALVRQGADVNAAGREGLPVLEWIMLCKNYSGIEKLLELGANPNQKSDDGLSPTWLAAGGDDSRLLPLMLKHGGNPNIWKGPRNALTVSMWYGRTQNFQLLLDHADVSAHDSGGNTVATYAEAERKYDIVIELLKRGYNYDLIGFAHAINNSIAPNNSALATQKQKILDMLKERGVKFPLGPPAQNAASAER